MWFWGRAVWLEWIFGDAAIEAGITLLLCGFIFFKFVFSTDYRKWWIYKAIMGSQAKEAGYRTFRKKKKPEPPCDDTPPEEELKE